MKTYLVIEERAGEHSDLRRRVLQEEVPYCRCGGPFDGDTCWKCGRYIRELFRPLPVHQESFDAWERLQREPRL